MSVPPREDEQSIKDRGSQLYRAERGAEPEPVPLEARRRKPFAAYLAETPAMQMSRATRAALTAIGLVVVGMFLASVATVLAHRSGGEAGGEAGREAGRPAPGAELGGVTSGVVAWFKADAIGGLSDGAAVGSWDDSGGRGNTAKQADPAAAPTFAAAAVGGKPAVRFDAARKTQLAFPRPVQDDFTIFVVFRTTRGDGNGGGWWDASGLVDGEMPGDVEDLGTSIAADGRVVAGTGKPDTQVMSKPGLADGKPHLLGFTRVRATGAIALFIDGATADTKTGGNASLTAPARLVMGSLQPGHLHYTGDIAEVVLYDRALPDAERRAVEEALGAKYGIGGLERAASPADLGAGTGPRWSDLDIGSPGQPGDSSNAGGTWTINGGGSDIWETADQFHFAAEAHAGDGSLVARVAALTNIDPWTKAGVMFRDSPDPKAMNAAVIVTPGNGLAFQWRAATGAANENFQVGGVAPPVWLKITRSGNSFLGSYSTDGTTWKPIGEARTVPMNPTALAGLAVTAHNNAARATATFDGVALTP